MYKAEFKSRSGHIEDLKNEIFSLCNLVLGVNACMKRKARYCQGIDDLKLRLRVSSKCSISSMDQLANENAMDLGFWSKMSQIEKIVVTSRVYSYIGWLS